MQFVLKLLGFHLRQSVEKNDRSKHAQSRTDYRAGIRVLCYAFHAFHIAVIVSASLLLEESKRAKGYYHHHSYGSPLCNRLLCWSLGYQRKQRVFHLFGVSQRML
ncbi:hypothetical protein V8G54_034211 [Vigna mungo]|uniref:Uncharacterized protein n=1 Tax=Vigna mungo TaxID=3915 RepID=A0AAQ3MQE2_VIGMU